MVKWRQSVLKIIFLDFDGVLNSEIDYRWQVEHEGKELNDLEDISPRCVGLINGLIKETEAEVVISSTWRLTRTPEQLQELLEKFGFTGKIIGVTPSLGEYRVRGNEIMAWIEQNISFEERYNSNLFRYVILDDDSDMLLWQSDNYIHVDGYIGLTPNVIYKATRKLNGVVN